jgi:hypothetical protein
LFIFVRYLVIIDDIWHWEEWEVIRKALPKNNLGSKLITTTRLWTIAQKFVCGQHGQNGSKLAVMGNGILGRAAFCMMGF